MVPADEVTFGVAVYGILVENERVLCGATGNRPVGAAGRAPVRATGA